MLSWFEKKKRDPIEALAQALGEHELPSFPVAAQRVLALLRAPDASLAEAGDALAEDPGLSARVLALANSSAYALRHPVRNVGQALGLLGRGPIESLVLGVVVRRTLPTPPIEAFDPPRFWRAAARRAASAQALADLLHPRTRSESFTASLLGDMAVPLLGAAHGERYGAVLTQWHHDGGDLAALEREALGVDHAGVAGWVAQRWRLPELLADAIGGHHDGENDLPAVALVAPLDESPAPALEPVVDVVAARHGVETDRVVALLRDAFARADGIAARMA